MKSVRIWSFFGLYFPAFGLNKERYGVILHYFLWLFSPISLCNNFQFSLYQVEYPGSLPCFVYIFLSRFPSTSILKGRNLIKLTGKFSQQHYPHQET